MRRACWVAGMALLAGCANPAQERARAYNLDGVQLFQQGAYRDAGESFRAALVLQPNDPGLRYNLGQCYDRLGDAARAERYYRECLQIAPTHAECRHSLDLLLVSLKREAEAAALIADWLAREPKRAAAVAEDGWLIRQQGDLPRAQARLQEALALDPHDARALTELAQVYEQLNRPDRAVALYESVLKRDPKQTELIGRVNYLLTKGPGKPRPE